MKWLEIEIKRLDRSIGLYGRNDLLFKYILRVLEVLFVQQKMLDQKAFDFCLEHWPREFEHIEKFIKKCCFELEQMIDSRIRELEKSISKSQFNAEFQNGQIIHNGEAL